MPVALDRHRATPTATPHEGSPSTEDEADVTALIARLTAEVNEVACEKTRSIQKITNQMKMLALNALIESSRAGAQAPALQWWRRKCAMSASRSRRLRVSSRPSSPTAPAI